MPLLRLPCFRTIIALSAASLALVACHAVSKEVHDDFEGRELSQVWSNDRFEPGAVEIQSAVVHAGRGAAKITVHQGDKREGTGPLQEKETERAELLERDDLFAHEGNAFAYQFSLFLPKDFPMVPTRLVLAQWKQRDSKGTAKVDNPVVALRYVSGELTISLQTGPEKKVIARLKEDLRGRWLDFTFHLKLTRSSEGMVRVWLDGKLLADFHGVTAYTEQYGYPRDGVFYFKMGLYRDRMPEPMAAYFDDYQKRQLTPAELK